MTDQFERAPETLTQGWIDQRVFDLYDEYCHGRMDRRSFLARSAAVTAGGLAMAYALLPNYAKAQTISFTDERIKARYVSYPSPGGSSARRARTSPTCSSRLTSRTSISASWLR